MLLHDTPTTSILSHLPSIQDGGTPHPANAFVVLSFITLCADQFRYCTILKARNTKKLTSFLINGKHTDNAADFQ
ncbi:hypothetical protein [Methylomarinum vadi]|uniref:hypothetical protein n=1 Tax=Methylomarinum vadi TaxID=438855 RepID=UPI0004DF7452|nr:hypothetical protein [Methylomarinum vadi]